jgi:hypothetical protein
LLGGPHFGVGKGGGALPAAAGVHQLGLLGGPGWGAQGQGGAGTLALGQAGGAGLGLGAGGVLGAQGALPGAGGAFGVGYAGAGGGAMGTLAGQPQLGGHGGAGAGPGAGSPGGFGGGLLGGVPPGLADQQAALLRAQQALAQRQSGLAPYVGPSGAASPAGFGGVDPALAQMGVGPGAQGQPMGVFGPQGDTGRGMYGPLPGLSLHQHRSSAAQATPAKALFQHQLALQQQQIAQGGLLDTNAMLATAMLGMMAQNSGGSSSSSGLGEQGGTGITEDAFEGMRLGNMARGHTAVANLQQRPMTDPTSVLLPFIATINERGGRYREGADGYSVYQYVLTLFNLYPRILGSGQHKSIKKMLVALGWLWDLGRRQGLLEHPHSLPVMAALTQIFKVVEGAALAEGRWNDWDLLPVPDP